MKVGVGGAWFVAVCVFLLCGFPVRVAAQVPTYEVTGGSSVITFEVESSVPIKGTFDKWSATMKFGSVDVKSGVLDIVIQADSVDTGNGLKNGKLKGKDFFNVKESPTITFRSNKVVQTGPNTFELDGDFSIRGVKKAEKLSLIDHGKGSTEGTIEGTMAFDRKDYGMTKNIPFVKIADRVEVKVNLKWKRVSGPAPVFEQ
jgi:polyisoprenoid-binding protein YceI